ncbi:MAG TPA: glycosyltransferase family 1 protein [Synergistaceae bacterium]|nr:glycosyltransferase family 1 protein [Synergistaceae bacterium]
MKILIVTDAWHPQVNGVVRTIEATSAEMKRQGHEISLLTPQQFPCIPCPTYPEISLAWPFWQIFRYMEEIAPQAIHIATEGPLGLGARRWCVARGIPFTTSFTTRFPEYLQSRFRISPEPLYGFFRWFHAPSAATMVSTKSLMEELRQRDFANLRFWSRGVDTELFSPSKRERLFPESPVFLYVGRVAVEKNLPAFLSLNLPGVKVVVGSGPDLERLRKKFPKVRFLGTLEGEKLARIYASADVFVFPSKTDTFGMVILEALASGLPVAAYPVTGPKDILLSGETGILSENLAEAALEALFLDRKICRSFGECFSWQACTEEFLCNLALRKDTEKLCKTG